MTTICKNPDCGKEFTPTTPTQLYCCPRCKWHTHDLRGRGRVAAVQKDKRKPNRQQVWGMAFDPYAVGLQVFGPAGVPVPMSTSANPWGMVA